MEADLDLRKQGIVLAIVLLVDLLLGIGIIVGIVIGPEAGKCLQSWTVWEKQNGAEWREQTGDDRARLTSTKQEYIEPKVVALTFDDGPNKEYTERLLQGLRERDVEATFFLVGESIEGNEELVKQMVDDGHLIGIHCMQHRELTKESIQEAVAQLRETKEMVEGVFNDERNGGCSVEYVRPPFGSWNEALDEAVRVELGLEPVFWDVDSMDWQLQNVSAIVKKVIRDTENGDIILMHDEFGTSVEAALQIIDNLMAKGYTFVTVNELMVD